MTKDPRLDPFGKHHLQLMQALVSSVFAAFKDPKMEDGQRFDVIKKTLQTYRSFVLYGHTEILLCKNEDRDAGVTSNTELKDFSEMHIAEYKKRLNELILLLSVLDQPDKGLQSLKGDKP